MPNVRVRLRNNMIIDGKFLPRDTVLDETLIPEGFRNGDHLDYDLDDRHGKVLLLRDLSFQSLPRQMSDGVNASFPVRVNAGETLDLSTVPKVAREKLVEGEDYLTAWTNETRDEILKQQGEAYLKQFESEPAVPTSSSL